MPVVGDILGRYTLLKKLAVGGMGEIYVAAKSGPLGLGAPIALKVLRDEFTQDQTFVDMLVDEANICRFLNHQNVVSVTDFGEDLGTYFIAMEYVQGVTLQYVLEQLRNHRKRMPLGLSLFVQAELCRALRHAHTRKNYAGEPLNIIHRDVTPGNLLLSIQGEVKLTDFGIARAKGRNHKTQAGILKGKFGYMAPEMIRQEEIDARADIFCAGIVLYEMLTTRHPVHGASLMEAITAFEQQSYKPPSGYNKQLPQSLDDIVMKALAPNPKERWDDAEALSRAIQDVIVNDKQIRSMANNGGPYLTKLIKKFDPEVFESPIPESTKESAPASTWIPDEPRVKNSDPLAVALPNENAGDESSLVTLSPKDNSERPTAHMIDAISDTDIAEAQTSANTDGLSPVAKPSEEVTIDASDLSADELQALVNAGLIEGKANPQRPANVPAHIAPLNPAQLQHQEVRPSFEEGVIGNHGQEKPDNDYDDGPTAFAPAPEEALREGKAAFASAPTSPTPVVDKNTPILETLGPTASEDSPDATLLDGFSLADIEAAKREYEEQQKQQQEIATQDEIPASDSDATDDNLDATRIRMNIEDYSDVPSILAEVSKPAKELNGPLRVRVTTHSEEIQQSPDAETRLKLTNPKEQATASPVSDVPDTDDANFPPTIIPEARVPEPSAVPNPPVGIPSYAPPAAVPPAAVPPAAVPPGPGLPVGSIDIPKETKNLWLMPSITVFVLLLLMGTGFVLISDRFWPRLTLISMPSGARIILNHRPTKGTAPLTLKVKPFVAHEIEFQLNGHHSIVKRVEAGLMAKELIEVRLAASEHFIDIKPQPGSVFVNDRKIGMAARVELPSIDALGQIEIKVEASGYKTWKKIYTAAKDVPHTIKVRLEQK